MKPQYKWLILALLVVLTASALGFCVWVWPVYDGKKTVSYRFTLKNTTNRVLSNPEFWVYAPVKETAAQRCCKRLDVSETYQLETDEWGNQVLHFKLPPLPPYADRMIQITATLTTAVKPNRTLLAETRPFVGPAELIESGHADIKARAEKLKADNLDQTARKIYDWVADNVRDIGYVREAQGALYGLQHKQGDCTESAYLFVALARANGIPARPVSGYYLKNNGLLKADEFHEWAEFYDGTTWRIADPQKRVFDSDYADYVALHRLDNRPEAVFSFDRFRHSADGLEVTMN